MQRVNTWATVGSLAAGFFVALSGPSPAVAAGRTSVLSAAAGYARSHGYHVGIAVYDTRTKQVYGGGDTLGPFASESVVKVMIANRLIVQGRMYGTTAHRAWKMITQSDDGIATSFYGSVGGDGLINWVKRRYHVHDLGSPPSSPGYWGNTHITPRGLVTYYARMKHDPRVAPWLITAMRHIRRYGSDGTYQYFGLPSATSGAAVKQGWGCDFASGCGTADFNTTGLVNHARYAVAILARGPLGTYGSAIGSMLTRTARILLPGGHFPAPRPMVRALTRTKGRTSGGQRVGLHGSDFTGVRAVLFGKIRGTAVNVRGPQFLRVTTPVHAAGRFPIRVVTTHGTSPVGTVRFTFGRAAAINAAAPRAGSVNGGTRVTIKGVRLAATTRVLFGQVPGTNLRVVSAGSIKVTSPKHRPGDVDIRVVSPFGWSAKRVADRFQFAGSPTITHVRPGTGSTGGGAAVTITGTHLSQVTTVQFGRTPATNLVHVSPTSLTAVTPAHQPGQVDVVASGPGGRSPLGPGAVFVYQ